MGGLCVWMRGVNFFFFWLSRLPNSLGGTNPSEPCSPIVVVQFQTYNSRVQTMVLGKLIKLPLWINEKSNLNVDIDQVTHEIEELHITAICVYICHIVFGRTSKPHKFFMYDSMGPTWIYLSSVSHHLSMNWHYAKFDTHVFFCI